MSPDHERIRQERERALILYQHQLTWAQVRLIEVRSAWKRRMAAQNDQEIVLSTDAMALQLRMALESFAFATLATNEVGYTAARPDAFKDWHARRILKSIHAINPNFYPWPFTIALLPTGKHINAYTGQYMTMERFIEAYDAIGEMLHAPSFIRDNSKYHERGATVHQWATMAERLIASHVVELPGHGFVFANVNRNTAVCRVQLAEPMDGEPFKFERPIP
jgi:hypothetical protein